MLEGMLGNVHDLAMILEWYTGFFNEDKDWTDAMATNLSYTIMTLVLAFDHIKQYYHHYYSLIGTNQVIAVSSLLF
jgi:hypothetical protein